MRVQFLEEARLEFLDAISGYEADRPGLGQRFKDELDRCVRWVIANPEILRVRHGGYRRINLHVFPYYVPYVIRGDVIWLLAVAHGSRKPCYWIGRKKAVS